LKVVLKLYASLTDYLPQQGRDQRHAVDVEVPAQTTIDAVIERFNLPRRSVHLVLVNGVYVAPAQRASRTLAEGDHLAIWPPVAGG
jgi:sulfur carrier protein ThiS